MVDKMAHSRTPEELKKDLEGMKNPDIWPQWPVLPVKRHSDEKGIEVGLIVEKDMKSPVESIVYLNNMFSLKSWEDLDKMPNLKYESFEALQADGWVVD